MKFKPCAYNFSAFRDGDVFFSHGCTFIGWLIRMGQKGRFGPMDLSQPNHAGFLYSIEGQWFAAEVGFKGITLTSIDQYKKTSNQIVAVMRFNAFDADAIRKEWKSGMARWIRKKQESGYDFMGAIRSAIKWWPWGNDSQKEFCSEDVQAWLKKFNATLPNLPLDPLDLYDTLTRNKAQFDAVLQYKTEV